MTLLFLGLHQSFAVSYLDPSNSQKGTFWDAKLLLSKDMTRHVLFHHLVDVTFQNFCWSPNPQYFSMWLYLEIRCWKSKLSYMSSLDWGLNQYDWCSWKKWLEYLHTEGRLREDRGLQWSANQAEKPEKKPTLMTPSTQTALLQKCEKMHFGCLSHQSIVFCHGGLKRE